MKCCCIHTHTHAGGFYKRIAGCLGSLSLLFPNRIKVVEHEFPDRGDFRQWLVDDGFRNHFSAEGKQHVSSPVVWFGKSDKEGGEEKPDPTDIERYLGGHDAVLDWCRDFVNPSVSMTDPITMVDDGHTADHGYDYDLIVIGGGSGGMAAAKEAAAFEAPGQTKEEFSINDTSRDPKVLKIGPQHG